MPELPSGTVTFLFSDIEGSTSLLQHLGDRYADMLADHRQLLRAAFQAAGGYEVDTAGDGFFVAFHRATDAAAAAVAAQRVMATHPWAEGVQVRVRLGLHTGEPTLAAGGYVGLDIHRAARICAAGHGGQILLSQTTSDLVAHALPEGVNLRDLGEHRLKDLHRPEHLFQLVIPDLLANFPALRTLDSRPNNLPAQPTPLIGREQEGAAVYTLLRRKDVRLLTFTGPGGTGKTRLGLQMAADLIDDFADGVFFVPLAPISDPVLVAATIAQTLGVREAGGRSLLESLKDYLRDKQTLLLLDNFEQVISAAPLVAELLAACPLLKILATSREVLRLSGEHEFPVPSLAVPDLQHLPAIAPLAQYAAVALFIQRALAVKPDFAVNNENAPAVAEICVRLDGLPLAIELAAARIKLLPPKALLARLGSRLELLRGGPRDLPARHQTLRRAIAWSHALLDAGEKALFRRLAVFVDGCTLEAAEAVCNAAGDPSTGSGCALELNVLDGMASLVDKSLLRQEEGVDGEPRLRMLQTIREYGLECLTASGETEATQRAHAGYYRLEAEGAEPELTGSQQVMWLKRLEQEHGNLRAALEWMEENQDAEAGFQLGGALWRFWLVRGYLSEGRERLERLLALAGASKLARAKVLLGTGTLAQNQGAYVVAQSLFEESLAIWRELGDQRGIATSLNHLGWVAWHLGEPAAARSLSEEGLAIWRELGDRRGSATSLTNLGYVAHHQGDYTAAHALHQEALDLRRALGDPRGIAFSLENLGWTVYKRGDYQQATMLLEEALALFRELGEKELLAWGLSLLADVAYHQGDYGQATVLLAESLPMLRAVGVKFDLAVALTFQGNIAYEQGETGRAMTLYAESLALQREIGDKWGTATSLARLGHVAQKYGDAGRARGLYAESLALQRELGNKHGIAECFEGLAEIAMAQGQRERAARLLGAAEGLRDVLGAPLPAGERARYARYLAAIRGELGEAAYVEVWAAGKGMTPEQAMALT
jgi:predicted ATPase/class 3 adenylate cyclase/Tfp pilus assembly protein PilF